MATWRMPPLPPKPALERPKVDFVSGGADSDVVVSYSGLDALEHNLRKLGDYTMDAAGFEMANIMRDVIADAKGEDWDASLVPIRTGALRDSGDHDEYKPGRQQTIIQIAAWFGAPIGPEASEAGIKNTSDYALAQHEDLTYEHEYGGPKYLEIPFERHRPTVQTRIAKAVASSLGGSAPLDVAFRNITTGPPIGPYGKPAPTPRVPNPRGSK